MAEDGRQTTEDGTINLSPLLTHWLARPPRSHLRTNRNAASLRCGTRRGRGQTADSGARLRATFCHGSLPQRKRLA
jgi:hypothetical protein